jgi:transmembrane sensor
MTDRIVVDVPASDARREHVERRVFEQLTALRIADRADAVAIPARRRWPVWVAAGGLATAACVAVVMLVGREPAAPAVASSPSLVQTPAGGASRFTVGDAVIDAGSDTSVTVQQDAIGGVTLALARGSVDCEVEPRGDRPPFRVVAGEVSVAVVGTRFTVARVNGAVRVDVIRGVVRVASPAGERLVAAGETWSSEGPIGRAAATGTASP